VNLIREYEPIEPEGASDPIGARLRAELREAPLRLRIVLPIYLGIGAFGGLYGGYALTSAYSNWITWPISLLILEPIGVASLLALAVMVSPSSAFAVMLTRALARAKLAALIVGLAFAGFLAWAILYLVLEFLKLNWPL